MHVNTFLHAYFREKAKRDYGKFTANPVERPILNIASKMDAIFLFKILEKF